MNQIKIGKFISECRKEKKLTQSQLAEKMNITGHKKSWARSWESQIRQFLSGKMGVRLDKDTTPIPR